MKKILILGVSAVQFDAIQYLKDAGYETHAVAVRNDGPGSNAADFFAEINILDEDKLIEYVKKNSIDCIYSTGSDLAMPVVGSISEKLGLSHFVGSLPAIVCNKKDKMRSKLGQDFDGNAKFHVLGNVTDIETISLAFPVIVKPTDSQGQRGVALVDNAQDLKVAFSEAKKYSRQELVIVEQYISGPEVSVNGYVVNGKLKFSIVSDRETWSNYTGLIHKHIVPSGITDVQVLEKTYSLIERACHSLEINNGPVYAQIKIEHGKPYIIEITPRLDGCHMWRLLEYSHGFNLMKLTFEHLLHDDTSELLNIRNEVASHVLEFICQEPNTKATYTEHEESLQESLHSFNYYNHGDDIRAINGKYEKIGYYIYSV